MRHRSFAAVCFAVLCGVTTAAAWAATGDWVTGAALERQLKAAVSVSWSNIPLARALGSLSASQHVAIVLDRRVDPDQPIRLMLSQQPLAEGLRQIADHLKLGYCQFGPVAYFGPGDVAKQLRTLGALRSQQARGLSADAARKLLTMRTSHWDDLAEPRQLLADLAAEAEVRIIGEEKIPHDLWRASDLPPLTWIDRVTLLAAQFDLTFHVDKSGQKVELLPAPAKVVLSRTYLAGRETDELAKRWAEALPQAKIAVEGNKIRLDGLLEDHEFVEHRLRGTPTVRTKVTPGKEVYQLSIDNAPLDQVVQQLGQRLNLEFQWDRAAIDAAGISVAQVVSIKVTNASLDDLVRAVFDGTGLAFRRDDERVSIFPAEPRKRKDRD
jgi:hypothetical protein